MRAAAMSRYPRGLRINPDVAHTPDCLKNCLTSNGAHHASLVILSGSAVEHALARYQRHRLLRRIADDIVYGRRVRVVQVVRANLVPVLLSILQQDIDFITGSQIL